MKLNNKQFLRHKPRYLGDIRSQALNKLASASMPKFSQENSKWSDISSCHSAKLKLDIHPWPIFGDQLMDRLLV